MVSPRLLRLVNLYQSLAAALLVAVSFAVWPTRTTAILAGAAVMGTNLWALRYLVGKLASTQSRGLYAAGLMVKFFGLFGLMFVLLVVFRLDPLGMMMGLATLFAGVALGMTHAALGKSPMPPLEA